MKKQVDTMYLRKYELVMTKRTDEIIFSVRLGKVFHKKLKLFAVEQEVTIKQLFVECMERQMEEAKAKEKSSK